MTDPAAFILSEVWVALIGGNEKPGLIFVEGAEGETGVEVERFT